MRLLLLSPYLPHRRVGHGGGVAVFQMLQALRAHHDLKVLCFRRRGEEGAEADLRDLGIEVETVPFLSDRDRGAARLRLVADRIPRRLASLVEGTPYWAWRYRHRGLARRLDALVAAERPDAVQVEYFALAPYARRLKSRPSADRPLVVLDTIEVETLVRMRRLLGARSVPERLWRDLRLRRIRRYESAACGWADLVLTVSEQDRQILTALSGAPHVRTFPLGVPVEELPDAAPSFHGPPRILFVGSFAHPPNREAALWLARELVPALAGGPFADLVCEIAGREPPEELRRRAAASDGRLVVHGFVEDLDALFHRAWLFVAPLWSGGGIKIKILEALGRGAPVLTTGIGLDGIDAEVGGQVARADDPRAFTDAASALLARPGRLASLGAAGRTWVREHHGWPALARRHAALLESARRPGPV